jgi:hypothetical protein
MPDGKKDCFVVGPIGAPDSAVRVHADWLLEEIIGPVMSGYPEFTVHRADKLSQPGLIDTQVITFLLNADLVIADITTLNPNAFYEIGIRHMAQKPIIHMHKAGEKIPFDISAYRSIEFSLERLGDLRDARSRLEAAVKAVLTPGFSGDNPVTHARGVVHLQEQASDAQRVMLDEIEGIKDRLSKIEVRPRNYIIVDSAENRSRDRYAQPISLHSLTKPWESNSVEAKSAIERIIGGGTVDFDTALEALQEANKNAELMKQAAEVESANAKKGKEKP